MQDPDRDCDTQSLTDSVTDYPIENGRRYHKYHEGAYLYPNDEQELDRLDMQHHMFKMVQNGNLFHVPLDNPKHILDIGTGSGIWPIEMAALFPKAEITGTDLSPVQPTEVPENVHFLIDDATEEEWLWDQNHFDFIHTSHMTGAMPSFKKLLRQSYKYLKPGAYIECQEMDPKPKCDDDTMPPENPDGYSAFALHDWFDLNMRSSQDADPPRQFRIAHRIEKWMKETGFVDVQQRVYKVPTNPWHNDDHMKRIGSWSESNWLEALSGWSYKPFIALGWSKPEIEVFLVDVRKSIQNRSVHAYMDYYVVTGRKPLSNETPPPAPHGQGAYIILISHRQGRLTLKLRLSPTTAATFATLNWLTYANIILMSFGRHAYRHALKPPPAQILDHLWISDDLLAATFRRFANGQRRHGSYVPGPLEARRRLAKRRNTVLASMGGGSSDDLACLFGRNGREHMKWTDRPWQRAHLKPQENLDDYSLGIPEAPFPFYGQNPNTRESHSPEHQLSNSFDAGTATRSELLDQFLGKDKWGIEDARDFVRRVQIDLQREPRYSRQIFEKLRQRSDITEAIAFLQDPFLNTCGSGNFLAAMEPFTRTKTKRSMQTAFFGAINRALELGLIPADELCLIIKTLPKTIIEGNNRLGDWYPKTLRKHYRAMWTAIGRCNVLGYRDLDTKVVDAWLGQLLKTRTFYFAEEIIIATHNPDSDSRWASTLIKSWLEVMGPLDTDTGLRYPSKLLTQLDTDSAATCLIQVTESFVSSKDKTHRYRLLERWRDCLLNVPNVSNIASSHVWLDLPDAYTEGLGENLASSTSNLPAQHQIIVRLWVLRTLCQSVGAMYNQSARITDMPIMLLFNLYETTTTQSDGSFLSDLMRGILDVELPYNSLLLLAVDLKLGKLVNKANRKTLELLETSQISLNDVWNNQIAYNGVRNIFYGAFEQMVRHIDLTNSSSMEECLRLARAGDSESVWILTRLLDMHTPLKMSLHKAWLHIVDPGEKALVRYHPGPRSSHYPDPRAAVDFIHQLAIAVSCSEQLNPSRSFHLIRWLYAYLRKCGAPVYPSFVRAMYHAGVVRYRREGRSVVPTQYEYIMKAISKFEWPDSLGQPNTPSPIGLECPASINAILADKSRKAARKAAKP
ncbi:hypothetical protein N7510_006192, partial [Penicillium lagena]|uniref:uncharacterized protein n=1 Tax=Penicillium lagena TaxID=94218 RepID=UPI00254216DC